MADAVDWARVPVRNLSDNRLFGRVKVWEKTQRRAGLDVRARREAGDLVLESFPPEPVQGRTITSLVGEFPPLEAQIAAAFGWTARPWRTASIKDALGVPAILRAVTMISNIGGALQLDAYRNGVKLASGDRPIVVVRPDPFRTARDFFRDTFYSMATRGETWLWVARRDGDGQALSVIVVPAQEVTVEDNPANPLRPIIRWRDQEMPNEDMRQVTLLREPGELRGYGPLQVCGAAVSVAVEAQEWAANFFSEGGYPSIWIRAAGDLSGGLQGDPDTDPDTVWMSEVQRLKAQWTDGPSNVPKVTDEGILDVRQLDPNPSGAAMLDSRNHQNGDAARMFGIPGDLLEYAAGGSSLTYQNLAELMTTFLKTCLVPNYLEPVEQVLSDLLTRSTIARFNVAEVNRSDVLTRFQVYQLGIGSGVLTVEQAQEAEGIIPGSVETAPVPTSPPQAIPASLPPQVRAADFACDGSRTRRRGGMPYVAPCDKVLPVGFTGTCPRCRKVYQADAA